MTDLEHVDSQPADAFGRILLAVTRALAIIGGVVLCAMAVLTTVSVSGRSLASVSDIFGPILGDFELIAVGTGIAVFAFMPYCQLKRANVIVDFFMLRAPTRVKAALDALGCLMYGTIMALFAWRTTIGGFDFYRSSETTYMLGMPRWWTFPLAVICIVLLLIVCIYTLTRSLDDFKNNRLSQ